MGKNKLQTQHHTERLPDDFLKLSHQILFSANKRFLRIDFLLDVGNIILNFSGCDIIELWIKESEEYLRGKIVRITKKTSKFEIIPFIKNKEGEHKPVVYKDSKLEKLCFDIIIS